ncbi:2-dehydropantoate 2-reductase [Bacillus mesophilus]|uniref:2-dehydropantoate 2-reductase n=1 Tax=Bacillus mesophilus TaxID=1808955 RepID=A0A6M0QAV3_9BACI|nr:2-dehydropantoate 2-reductase [Bacillus mesophilus]MBM7661961.1 2-dehydropantoate 2-reductase [Bacillus mesophilus]NEY72680.1 2-dehydropantoate 2-reductase [Bacillus mesophilus]
MKIVVVGTGAIGGYFGGYLHKGGNEVTFIARGQHLSVMKEQGLKLSTELNEWIVHATFTDQYDDISDADLVLFTVKSTETKSTIQKIKPYMDQGTARILTLQNGVDNEEVLIEMFGIERVLTGSAYISSQVKEPGHVVQQGNHAVFIGCLHHSQEQFVEQISLAFKEAGVTCILTDQIMKKKWDKLLWNVTFNPLSAVSKATVGEILDHEHLNNTAHQVLEEAINIAVASGIPIHEDMKTRIFVDANSVRSHQTSMLQDRLKGKPMEIQSLCGFFVRKGQELEVDVPVIKTIYSLLAFIETRG